ncbi:MAG: hypothetical protein U9Q92_03365 [archaeon]|nr:hypothetical protein [archaeon]
MTINTPTEYPYDTDQIQDTDSGAIPPYFADLISSLEKTGATYNDLTGWIKDMDTGTIWTDKSSIGSTDITDTRIPVSDSNTIPDRTTGSEYEFLSENPWAVVNNTASVPEGTVSVDEQSVEIRTLPHHMGHRIDNYISTEMLGYALNNTFESATQNNILFVPGCFDTTTRKTAGIHTRLSYHDEEDKEKVIRTIQGFQYILSLLSNRDNAMRVNAFSIEYGIGNGKHYDIKIDEKTQTIESRLTPMSDDLNIAMHMEKLLYGYMALVDNDQAEDLRNTILTGTYRGEKPLAEINRTSALSGDLYAPVYDVISGEMPEKAYEIIDRMDTEGKEAYIIKMPLIDAIKHNLDKLISGSFIDDSTYNTMINRLDKYELSDGLAKGISEYFPFKESN